MELFYGGNSVGERLKGERYSGSDVFHSRFTNEVLTSYCLSGAHVKHILSLQRPESPSGLDIYTHLEISLARNHVVSTCLSRHIVRVLK
jgi:hypothetical protein